MSETRLCFECKVEQLLEEFYIEAEQRRARVLGRSSIKYACRSCRSRAAARRMAPRRAIINAAKAGGCVDCGLVNLEHPEVFDFDHLPGFSKAGNIANFLTRGSIDQLHAEILKCEVVCANCHRIRTARRPPVHRGRSRK